VVALFPDHGSRYLGKVFNDEWMKQQGFISGDQDSQYYQQMRKLYRLYRIKYKRYIRKTMNRMQYH